MTALLESARGAVRIEDILPLFPDFVEIDAFKDAICRWVLAGGWLLVAGSGGWLLVGCWRWMAGRVGGWLDGCGCCWLLGAAWQGCQPQRVLGPPCQPMCLP